EGRFVVTARLDPAEMLAVLVRAGDVLALAKRLVGDHLEVDADRAQGASPCTECGADLLVGRRAERALEERLELLGAEPVVAADEREDEPVARHDGERLRG